MCDYAAYRTPNGWKEIEPPEDDDPLKRWKAHPVEKKKHTGIEFLDDYIR